MSSTLHCLLVPLIAAALPLTAQVHEAEAPMDLERGLVLTQDMKHGVEGFSGPAALKTNVGQNSFAIALFVAFPPELQETVIVSQWHDAQGWRFLVTADGALRFEGRSEGRKEPILVSTAPGVIAPDTQHHLVVNVLRDATKPNAGIWVDGVEIASGVVPPVDLNPLQRFLKEPQMLSMHVGTSHFRLYNRDLTRPEILALQLKATTLDSPAPKHPDPPANGPRFIPQPDETIALIGGTEAVALAESGELEAMLLMAFPETRFHFRSLAWEGDTVFRQDRPLNFGSLEQQLKRVNAGSVFVMFGRQECLEGGRRKAEGGNDGIAEFTEAFGKLLDEVQKVTPNVVVIGGMPFEKKAAPLPDLSVLNVTLKNYEQVMKTLTEERGILFADGYGARSESPFWDNPPGKLTADGAQLSDYGCRVIAGQTGDALNLTPSASDVDKRVFDQQTAQLISRIHSQLAAKNRLWHDYWRPSNWAFLHGDRTQQPSSRDPVNPQVRILPAEQEKYLPLLKEAEDKVYRMVEEATKKLP